MKGVAAHEKGKHWIAMILRSSPVLWTSFRYIKCRTMMITWSCLLPTQSSALLRIWKNRDNFMSFKDPSNVIKKSKSFGSGFTFVHALAVHCSATTRRKKVLHDLSNIWWWLSFKNSSSKLLVSKLRNLKRWNYKLIYWKRRNCQRFERFVDAEVRR